jgi:aryl-alcohol dehydrogenase-like predicted oxidoreductase
MPKHPGLEKRSFGSTDLKVSSISFGGASLGSRADRKQSARAAEEAFAHGVNYYDTAPFYGQGESEKIIGNVFRHNRTEVVISTKIGLYPSAFLRVASKLKPIVRSVLKALPGAGQQMLQKSVQGVMRSSNAVDFDPDSIERSLESSLVRLRTDYIDLLLLHVTPGAESICDVLDKLQTLQKAGKIRYYGASAAGVEETTMWLGLQDSGISSLQVRLNMFEIPVIEQCLPRAILDNVAIVAREPFAQGQLLPPRAERWNSLGFIGEGYDDRFEFLAIEGHRTVPQAAIKFLLQTKGVTTVLSGMTTISHLYENLAALSTRELTEAEMERIHDLGMESSD